MKVRFRISPSAFNDSLKEYHSSVSAIVCAGRKLFPSVVNKCIEQYLYNNELDFGDMLLIADTFIGFKYVKHFTQIFYALGDYEFEKDKCYIALLENGEYVYIENDKYYSYNAECLESNIISYMEIYKWN